MYEIRDRIVLAVVQPEVGSVVYDTLSHHDTADVQLGRNYTQDIYT